MIDENSHIAKARNGDHEALNAVVSRYWPPTYQFLYSRIGNREIAQAITQETFERAFRSFARYKIMTKNSFQTYLGRIAINLLNDYWRKNGQKPPIVDISDYQNAFTNVTTRAEDLYVNQGIIRELVSQLGEELASKSKRCDINKSSVGKSNGILKKIMYVMGIVGIIGGVTAVLICYPNLLSAFFNNNNNKPAVQTSKMAKADATPAVAAQNTKAPSQTTNDVKVELAAKDNTDSMLKTKQEPKDSKASPTLPSTSLTSPSLMKKKVEAKKVLPDKVEVARKSTDAPMIPLVLPGYQVKSESIDNDAGVVRQVYNVDDTDVVVTQRRSKTSAAADGTASKATVTGNKASIVVDGKEVTVEGRKPKDELVRIAQSLVKE